MGVTRENRDLFIYGFMEDDNELLQQTEEEQQPGEQQRLSKKNGSRNRTKTKSFCLLDSQVLSGRRTGSKQARRTENLRHLLALAEKDELGELQLDNVFEPSVSVFAKLFSEREKMKIWNDFINQSEEDQERILDASSAHIQPALSTDDEDGNAKLDDSWEEIPDKRAAHPAFSAAECYKKIDRKLKDVLKKRHLSMGILENLELEIVSFFTEWPSSVFVSKLASSYERMMVHALCQYLSLRSQSFDENGERRTQVENRHATFQPPSPLLSQYLQQQHS